MAGFLKIFFSSAGGSRASARPATRFRAIIERERSRADRSNTTLSLLAIAPTGETPNETVLNRLADFLADRLRVTDDFGLLDDNRMGVVLPDTSSAGAWKVADDVCDHMEAGETPVRCEVFAHPTRLPDELDEDDRHSRNGHEDATTNGNGRGNGAPDADYRHRGRPARPMAEILCQGLPWWKRSLDVLVSLPLLILLSPLFLAIAIVVKLTSRGPIFFAQQRCGLGGRTFLLYKFRSMVSDAEAKRAELEDRNEVSGPVFKIKRDPRITTIGHWLRRSSLDELPQLWNVLRGDMSLVGPRPPIPSETLEYDRWHRRRLEISPGITCIWQVSGRSNVPFTEWMRMDIRYAQSVSLKQDLSILMLTAPAVLTGKGAN